MLAAAAVADLVVVRCKHCCVPKILPHSFLENAHPHLAAMCSAVVVRIALKQYDEDNEDHDQEDDYDYDEPLSQTPVEKRS